MSDLTTTRWEKHNEAGRLFFLQGDLVRAEESFVAAIYEAEALGTDNARLASSLSNLGQLKYQQRDLAHAEQLFRRSLEIRERSLGTNHVSVAQNLNNLAALHVARNEHAEAEALLVRALHINEQERGSSHPDVAVTINNLAKLHFKRGDYANAEPLLLRLLAIKQTPDRHNPEAAAVLASLATLRQATGHPAAAEALWKETLDVRERSLSATDAALSPTLEGLADACEAQHRLAEAIAHRERALAIRLQVMGADHPVVTAARGRIAELRLRLTENAPATPGPAHTPRLSALQMSSLDVERALQDADRHTAPEPVLARGAASPWEEAEPPAHIVAGDYLPTGGGGAAVASPPRRGPTPASSATISPTRAPSPRSSTALPPAPGLGMFEVSEPATASIGAEPGIWWGPSSEPKHAVPHAAPVAHAPERRSDPVRRPPNRAHDEDSGHHVRRTHRTEKPAKSHGFGMVAGIAAALVLAFGIAAWTLLGREDASPPSPIVDRVAAAAELPPPAEPLEAPRSAPTPEPQRQAAVAVASPPVLRPNLAASPKVEPPRATSVVAAVPEKRASVSPARALTSAATSGVAPVATDSAPLTTTIDQTVLPNVADLDKITRAIDDSTRKKVDAATKKAEIKPPTFKEP